MMATQAPFALLNELGDGDMAYILPGHVPDEAILGIFILQEDIDATVFISVYDAMKLREGLDRFISQAVGADV